MNYIQRNARAASKINPKRSSFGARGIPFGGRFNFATHSSMNRISPINATRAMTASRRFGLNAVKSKDWSKRHRLTMDSL